MGVLGQVHEIAQSEDEGVIPTEGVDECLVRGEIDLDLADVVLGRDFGLGGVTSNDGDVKLARSNEGVKYRLAEGACGLRIHGVRYLHPSSD